MKNAALLVIGLALLLAWPPGESTAYQPIGYLAALLVGVSLGRAITWALNRGTPP